MTMREEDRARVLAAAATIHEANDEKLTAVERKRATETAYVQAWQETMTSIVRPVLNEMLELLKAIRVDAEIQYQEGNARMSQPTTVALRWGRMHAFSVGGQASRNEWRLTGSFANGTLMCTTVIAKDNQVAVDSKAVPVPEDFSAAWVSEQLTNTVERNLPQSLTK